MSKESVAKEQPIYLYSIADWDTCFEVAQNRRVVGPLSWVAIPTKHDGLVFRKLMDQNPTGSIYAAWQLIVQVAAKCPIRGTLSDGKKPLTAKDLELKTGFNEKHFQSAFDLLSGDDMAWLLCSEYTPSQSVLGDNSETATTTVQYSTVQDSTKHNSEKTDGEKAPKGKKRKPQKGIKEPEKPEDLPEMFNDPDFFESWMEYESYKRQKKSTLTDIGRRRALLKLRDDSGRDVLKAIEIIEHSMAQGWAGLYAPGDNGGKKKESLCYED